MFLVVENIKTFYSKTTWPNGTLFEMKHLCKVLYYVSSFCPDRTDLSYAPISVIMRKDKSEMYVLTDFRHQRAPSRFFYFSFRYEKFNEIHTNLADMEYNKAM